MTRNNIIYSEDYGHEDGTAGTLVVARAPKGQIVLVGYVPPGVDLVPMVFCRGTLNDCRKAYPAASEWMAKAIGPKV